MILKIRKIIEFHKMIKIKRVVFVLTIGFFLHSCEQTSVPRPYGFFRVDLPPHSYHLLDTLQLPYRFDMPQNAQFIRREVKEEKYWIDIYYPTLNASIYCSYKPVHNNLIDLSEDTRRIVYKHSIKADGITEKVFDHPQKNVYGVLYDLQGNTASPLQFVLTDSTRHFFRGALYFNNVPNKDSIAPMAEYIREDVIRLMESFEWNK